MRILLHDDGRWNDSNVITPARYSTRLIELPDLILSSPKFVLEIITSQQNENRQRIHWMDSLQFTGIPCSASQKNYWTNTLSDWVEAFLSGRHSLTAAPPAEFFSSNSFCTSSFSRFAVLSSCKMDVKKLRSQSSQALKYPCRPQALKYPRMSYIPEKIVLYKSCLTLTLMSQATLFPPMFLSFRLELLLKHLTHGSKTCKAC